MCSVVKTWKILLVVHRIIRRKLKQKCSLDLVFEWNTVYKFILVRLYNVWKRKTRVARDAGGAWLGYLETELPASQDALTSFWIPGFLTFPTEKLGAFTTQAPNQLSNSRRYHMKDADAVGQFDTRVTMDTNPYVGTGARKELGTVHQGDGHVPRWGTPSLGNKLKR